MGFFYFLLAALAVFINAKIFKFVVKAVLEKFTAGMSSDEDTEFMNEVVFHYLVGDAVAGFVGVVVTGLGFLYLVLPLL